MEYFWLISWVTECTEGVDSWFIKGNLKIYQLSEAKAFIGGLIYGYNAINGLSFSTQDVQTTLDLIGDDHSAVTIGGLNAAIDLIASKTGLENVKANL